MIADIVESIVSNCIKDIIYTPVPIDGQILDSDIITDDYVIGDDVIMGG